MRGCAIAWRRRLETLERRKPAFERRNDGFTNVVNRIEPSAFQNGGRHIPARRERRRASRRRRFRHVGFHRLRRSAATLCRRSRRNTADRRLANELAAIQAAIPKRSQSLRSASVGTERSDWHAPWSEGLWCAWIAFGVRAAPHPSSLRKATFSPPRGEKGPNAASDASMRCSGSGPNKYRMLGCRCGFRSVSAAACFTPRPGGAGAEPPD